MKIRWQRLWDIKVKLNSSLKNHPTGTPNACNQMETMDQDEEEEVKENLEEAACVINLLNILVNSIYINASLAVKCLFLVLLQAI